MKYRKQIIIVLTILILFSSLFLNKTKVNRKIAKDLEIKIPSTLNFYYTDSHGGFFGDGIALGRAELGDRDIDKLLINPKDHWIKTPIPEELNTILYGSNAYHSDLATRLSMKDIENGYWIYIDRFGNQREYLTGKELDRHNGNYSIGLLDLDEKKFYYVKFDS